jgi:K+/H+ antiporter YhaU regulatory subunit KhtT
MLFNPSADTRIEANDALVAIGSHSNLEALERLANTGVAGFAGSQRPL